MEVSSCAGVSLPSASVAVSSRFPSDAKRPLSTRLRGHRLERLRPSNVHLEKDPCLSGEDVLAARRFGVEISHGDDAVDLVNEVIIRKSEEVD